MGQAAADLVNRLRAGEDAAWKEYISSHGRLMFAAGRRAGLRQTDLEEAVQAACVEACRAIPSLRDPSKLSSWTYSIAFRCSVKIRRRKGPEISAEAIDGASLAETFASNEPSPEDVAIRIDQATRLRAALDLLGTSCRRLIEALYLETPQPSYRDISRQLNLPVGSIGPTRARCLEKLKKALYPVSGARASGTYRETPAREGGEEP